MTGAAEEGGLTADESGAGSSDESWDGATVVSACPLVDRLEGEAGTVVMVESGTAHRIVRLSLLGHEILDAVGEGITLGSLEDVILGHLGPPPDGDLSGAVQAAVREMSDARLLTVRHFGPDVTQS